MSGIVGVDPGVVRTGVAVVHRGRWMASTTIRGANGTARDWAKLTDAAWTIAQRVSAFVLELSPDVVAIETMADQGPARQAFRHRHTTAACCQAIWDRAVADGWAPVVVWQDADVVMRHGGQGYGDLAYLLRMGRAGRGVGAPAPLNEHEASAVVHALWAERMRAAVVAGR